MSDGVKVDLGRVPTELLVEALKARSVCLFVVMVPAERELSKAVWMHATGGKNFQLVGVAQLAMHDLVLAVNSKKRAIRRKVP